VKTNKNNWTVLSVETLNIRARNKPKIPCDVKSLFPEWIPRQKGRGLSMGSERVKLSEGAVILLVTMRVVNISESSFRPQHGQFEWLAPTRSPVCVNEKTSLTVRVVFTKIHHRYIHSTHVCISPSTLNSTPATGEWSASHPPHFRLGKSARCLPKTKLSGYHSQCGLHGEDTWMPNITRKSAYEIN